MYNSTIKFYFKKLFNRKNPAWYFDALVRSYSKRDRKLASIALQLTDDEKGRSSKSKFPNPLFLKGLKLRTEVMANYEGRFKSSHLRVLIHLPPVNLSPGINSWYFSIGESLKHMGVEVRYFWNESTSLLLNEFKPGLILTREASFFTELIDWKVVKEFKNISELKVATSAPIYDQDDNFVEAFAKSFIEKGFDIFFCYNHSEFAMETHIAKELLKYSKQLYSLEFGANPVFHYPNESVEYMADYIFLGSSNWDKAQRYHDYFKPVVDKFQGILTGPGWDWADNFEIKPQRDRLIYSKARIGLNLHIDLQLQNASEINERAYILAACGIPQLVDNPLVLPKLFDTIGTVVSTPNEYVEALENMLINYDEALVQADMAMQEVFEKHTTYHRLEKFLLETGVVSVNA